MPFLNRIFTIWLTFSLADLHCVHHWWVVCLCLADYKQSRSSLWTVLSCTLDRISSYTVSLLKRHYSIDDVLSRVSFPLRHYTDTHSGPTDCSSCAIFRGGPSNRYHYWVLAMVRVIWPSLAVFWTGRTRKFGDWCVIHELLEDIFWSHFWDVLVDACKIKLMAPKQMSLIILIKTHLKQGLSLLNILCLKDYFNVLADMMS